MADSGDFTRPLGERYEIVEPVGTGASATVYRARDRALDRDVAVKVLSDDLHLGSEPERFAREIATLERLQHRNIVPLLGSGVTGNTAYYVMPLATDGTLEDRLRTGGPLSVSAVRRLCADMTAALAHAHELGVIHRDVKPSNVLMSGANCWLADFGIMRFLQEAETRRFTPSGITVGSPMYMSPEQLLGRDGIDHRTDLYSLGLVLYECLAGVHAFPARTAEVSARMRLGLDPVPIQAHRPELDEALAATITRALRGDLGQRWSSALEMSHRSEGL